MKPYFKEEQRMTQWWLWLPLIAFLLFPLYGLYQQAVVGKPFGDNPMSNLGLVIVFFVMAGLLWFFRSIKLITEIEGDEFRMKFKPFMIKKTIKFQEISNAEIVNYGFVGYGIRWVGGKYGTVYNTAGRYGLFVQYGKGRKFVIGTQRKEELGRVISKILSGPAEIGS
ncbi:MAG TPA: hypothetical protein VK212_11165 [Lentimicrobium sp.]|nr:hypothetical protein [Lentimicrobium sp.]